MVMLNKVYSGLVIDYKITLHGAESFALYVRSDEHGWQLYDTYDEPEDAQADGEELMLQAETICEL